MDSNALSSLYPFEVMSMDALKSLLPALIPFLLGIVGLIFSPLKAGRVYAFSIVFLGLIASLFLSILNLSLPVVSINHIVDINLAGRTIQTLILFCSVLSLWMTFGRDRMDHLRAEVFPLMSFAIGAISLIPISNHLMFLFIAIEIMSLSVYVLVSMKRHEKASAEAGLKYFILGGVASGVFLYGMALFYGSTGHFFITETVVNESSNLLMLGKIGITLMILSMLFKIGAFPFHFWVADIYQGAPVSITSFMSTIVKIGAFTALLKIFHLCCLYSNLQNFIYPLMVGSSLITIFIGHLGAIRQKSLKRLLAYSSLAHTGYMVLGVVSEMKNFSEGQSIYLYLFFYAISNFGAFSLVSLMLGDNNDMNVEELSGLASIRPLFALCMSIFMLGMAGIPLTAGFVGKYWLLSNAVSEGLIIPVVLALLGSLISMYYYLRPIVLMYMTPQMNRAEANAQSFDLTGPWTICLMMGLLVILFGIFPKVPLQFLIAPLSPLH